MVSRRLVPLCCFTALFFLPQVVSVSKEEYLALLDFYNSTGGPTWHSSQRWLTGDPCQPPWVNIDCFNNTVTRIAMTGNGLVGTIPPSIGNLSSLKILYMNWNRIYGNIPSTIQLLSSLHVLDLSNNELSGTLPALTLTALNELHLEYNNLEGYIPQEVWRMRNLLFFTVHYNSLKGTIPDGINSRLISICLDGNYFNGTLPSTFKNLSALKELRVNGNQFWGDLEVFGYLTSLNHLNLGNNAFEGTIPPSFSSLTKLISLYLENNKFSGTIPSSLSRLQHLDTLNLTNTEICAPCLPFPKKFRMCSIKGVKQDCNCPSFPCGKENCINNLKCINCVGDYESLGICVGNTWIIQSSILNETNTYFNNTSIIINGNLNGSLHIQNSTVTLNGSLIETNKEIEMDSGYLLVKDDFKLFNSTISNSVDSTIVILGNALFNETTFNLNLKFKKPDKNEYLLISVPHSNSSIQWPILISNKNDQNNDCINIQQQMQPTSFSISISYLPCSQIFTTTIIILFTTIPLSIALLLLIRKLIQARNKTESKQLLKIT